MKKIILVFMALTTISLSHAANYTMIYPLEGKGAGLESGSISFKEAPPPIIVPPPPVKECSEDTTSRWTSGSAGYRTYTIAWEGVVISTGGDYTLDELTVDGYHYTKNGLIGNWGSYTQSKVCRIAI